MKEDKVQIVIASRNILEKIGLKHTILEILSKANITETDDVADLIQLVPRNSCNFLFISKELFIEGSDELQKLLNQSSSINYFVLDDRSEEYSVNVYDTENGLVDKLEHIFNTTLAGETKEEALSDREKEILRLVALGLTNKDIGEKLFISLHTVITHRKNITAKLGIKTIPGLTIYAVLNKVVDTNEIKM